MVGSEGIFGSDEGHTLQRAEDRSGGGGACWVGKKPSWIL